MTDPYTPRTEEPFTLASMAPPRRRTGLLVALIAGTTVLLAGAVGYALAGKDDSAAQTAAPSASPSTAVTTSATAAGETKAASSSRAACEQLASLSSALPNDAFTPADLTAIKSVAKAAASADSLTIATSGQLLLDSAEDAGAAQGRDDEPQRMESVTKYVRNLRKSCAAAGFPT